MEPLRRADHPELEELWQLYDDSMSFVPNSLFTMARRPEILQAFSELITRIWRARARARGGRRPRGSVGEGLRLEELERGPSPIYARLGDEERVSWVPAVGLWLATRYDAVRYVDHPPDVFTAETDPSTLNRTMGK